MGRAGDAVRHDCVGRAALPGRVEMHHLLEQPEVLLGEREHHLIDMAVPDVDRLAVHDVGAVEHHTVAERCAEPELMRRRADDHESR